MTHLEACIALNMVPGMGPVRLRRLLGVFGDAGTILTRREHELAAVDGLGRELAGKITRWRDFGDPESELKLAEEAGARIITAEDAEYPAALKEIHDPPIVLYLRGSLLPRDRQAVAVVGSRAATHYALDSARKLGFQLAYAGLTIVSGLARGIDTAAHTAALAAKGRTIAVLGSGLGRLYPPENQELADRIAENGAVISEFPMGTPPDRQTFPMRNRIISGCAFGVLVVEAGGNSGALISANQAAEQGRTLYAVPGRIDNPKALGSNRLIQQGAKLVLSAADVLDDLQILFRVPPELPTAPTAADLSEDDQAILEALGQEEAALDTLIARSGLSASTVSSRLLALEMRRVVKQLPGRRFVRLV